MDSSDMALYMKTRREERRARLVEMRGGRCERCGSSDGLEFNHIDRSTKKFGLSGAGLDTAWEKILEELNKCELLCSDCHKGYTKGQWSDKEIVPWNKDLRGPTVHGTARCYDGGCREIECKEAKSLYRKKLVGFTEVVILL